MHHNQSKYNCGTFNMNFPQTINLMATSRLQSSKTFFSLAHMIQFKYAGIYCFWNWTLLVAFSCFYLETKYLLPEQFSPLCRNFCWCMLPFITKSISFLNQKSVCKSSNISYTESCDKRFPEESHSNDTSVEKYINSKTQPGEGKLNYFKGSKRK